MHEDDIATHSRGKDTTVIKEFLERRLPELVDLTLERDDGLGESGFKLNMSPIAFCFQYNGRDGKGEDVGGYLYYGGVERCPNEPKDLCVALDRVFDKWKNVRVAPGGEMVPKGNLDIVTTVDANDPGYLLVSWRVPTRKTLEEVNDIAEVLAINEAVERHYGAGEPVGDIAGHIGPNGAA